MVLAEILRLECPIFLPLKFFILLIYFIDPKNQKDPSSSFRNMHGADSR